MWLTFLQPLRRPSCVTKACIPLHIVDVAQMPHPKYIVTVLLAQVPRQRQTLLSDITVQDFRDYLLETRGQKPDLFLVTARSSVFLFVSFGEGLIFLCGGANILVSYTLTSGVGNMTHAGPVRSFLGTPLLDMGVQFMLFFNYLSVMWRKKSVCNRRESDREAEGPK